MALQRQSMMPLDPSNFDFQQEGRDPWLICKVPLWRWSYERRGRSWAWRRLECFGTGFMRDCYALELGG
ncbi:hypothetical protein E1A91_A08G079600v1 [Gossypium mustelinum]|uniref:Uncharacterized protein n=2 Tax=Gossypium TaxID=3633 RepID=A0A5D2Y608_GOSMU|nr:hypothetical protein ES332_A08G081800v1 [Gossypium tomentosum]TYJ21697.1 hypothetical protein E1A91_A08G079600v1 [Gossypium mustelinum]